MTVSEITGDRIVLHDAPRIPGLSFRRFRGESDFPKMAAVIDDGKVADQIERTQSAEDVARTYSQLKNCDPYRDTIFAEVDGRLVGYGRGWWEEELDGTRLYGHIGFLASDWRRRGIGRAVLRFLEARLREVAAGHPPGRPRFFQAFLADTQVGAEALLRSEGYAPVRHFFNMLRPNLDGIPDLPLPEGVEVRPVRPEQLRAIWEAHNDAFRDHWGYIPPSEQDYQAWLNGPEFQPDIWKVAWAGEEVVGTVLGFILESENAEYHRRRGYTEDISVRKPWRKRGVARALIAHNLRELKARGMTEAALGVDTENPTGALRVYESMGFRAVKRFSTYRKLMGAGELLATNRTNWHEHESGL